MLEELLGELIGKYGLTRDQLVDWLVGPIDGGPTGDGRYPITAENGATLLMQSPARIARAAEDVTNIVGEGSLLLVVGDRRYATVAAMNATPAPAEGAMALVYADADPKKNAFYTREGGAWVARLPVGPNFELFDQLAQASVANLVDDVTQTKAQAQAAQAGSEDARDQALAAKADVDQSAAVVSGARAFVEDNLLTPAPPVAGRGAMTFFGQESADRVAADTVAGRGLTLPVGALRMPAAGKDWWCAIHCRTGDQLISTTGYETLASTGLSLTASNNRGIALGQKNNANRPWQWDVAVNQQNADLLAGLTPALATQPKVAFGDWCVLIACVSGAMYLALGRIGYDNPQRFFGRADGRVGGFGSFHFPAATHADGTIERAAGVLTYRKTGTSGGFQAGDTVYIESVDRPDATGIYTIATRLAGNAGFTAISAGTDIAVTGANASVAEQRNPVDLFAVLGRFQSISGAGASGWAGGIQRIEMRHGTVPVAAGQIDGGWFDRLANFRLSDAALPGAKVYGNWCDPTAGYVADAGAMVTTALTPLDGTPLIGTPMTAGHLHLEPRAQGWPFATIFGRDTGTVEWWADTSGATGSIIARVEDVNGLTIWPERVVAVVTDPGKPRIRLVLDGVPEGVDHQLVAYWAQNPAQAVRSTRFAVGAVYGSVSQSTKNVLFNPISTGGTLAPTTNRGGVGLVAAGVSNTGTNYTDQKGWLRLSLRRIRAAGQVGNGATAWLNKLIELRDAARGRPTTAALVNLCRSGHPAEFYWGDRQRFVAPLGNAVAGVALAGNWLPHAMWCPNSPRWCKRGSVRIYRGGVFAKVDPADPYSDYDLTGGVLVGEVLANGTVTGSIAGTFSHGSNGSADPGGAFSLIDPVGGMLYASAEIEADSEPGSTGTRLVSDGFTAFGSEIEDDSGHISNLLKATPRMSAISWSWANYLLSWAGGAGRSQAEVNAKVAFDIARVRRRFQNYPAAADLPWIIECDMRTTSTSSIGEHRIRIAMREYAKTTPNTYYAIGAINCDMDMPSSPHAGALDTSGRFAGLVAAHGLAAAEGIAGAKAYEARPVAATRSLDGTTIDLDFDTGGAALTNAGGEVEGIYWRTANGDLTPLDLSTVSCTLNSATRVRIRLDSGTWPAGTYWNYGVGFLLTGATLAAEAARLNNALSLDSGGYDGIRPGSPVQFAPADVLAVQGLA